MEEPGLRPKWKIGDSARYYDIIQKRVPNAVVQQGEKDFRIERGFDESVTIYGIVRNIEWRDKEDTYIYWITHPVMQLIPLEEEHLMYSE